MYTGFEIGLRFESALLIYIRSTLQPNILRTFVINNIKKKHNVLIYNYCSPIGAGDVTDLLFLLDSLINQY